jgi:hypothetical protein
LAPTPPEIKTGRLLDRAHCGQTDRLSAALHPDMTAIVYVFVFLPAAACGGGEKENPETESGSPIVCGYS